MPLLKVNREKELRLFNLILLCWQRINTVEDFIIDRQKLPFNVFEKYLKVA